MLRTTSILLATILALAGGSAVADHEGTLKVLVITEFDQRAGPFKTIANVFSGELLQREHRPVVMRNGVSLDDLAIPTDSGSMYALEQSEYEWMQGRTVNTTEVNFKVQGETYNSMEAALDNAFGRDSLCQHNAYSSTFDCTRIFKKN